MKKIAITFFLASLSTVTMADFGQVKYNQMCIGCHGAKGEGIVGPKVQGMTSDEVTDKLLRYQNREMIGPKSVMMWGPAKQLGVGDIEAVSNYISTL